MPKAGSKMSGTGYAGISKMTIVDENKIKHVNAKQLPAEMQDILARAKQQNVQIPPGMELQIVNKEGSYFGNDGIYIARNNYLAVYTKGKHPKLNAWVLAHELGHADFAARFPKQTRAIERSKLGSAQRKAQEDYANAVAELLTGSYRGDVHDENMVKLPKGY